MLIDFFFLHNLSTISAFIPLIGANLHVIFIVTFLESHTTVKWAIDLLGLNDLFDSSIWFRVIRILFSTARAIFPSKHSKTLLTNNRTALGTIIRDVRQLPARNALEAGEFLFMLLSLLENRLLFVLSLWNSFSEIVDRGHSWLWYRILSCDEHVLPVLL